VRIYTEDGKVFARTENDLYLLRLRLYELEERLDSTIFVRISNSEIVNLKKVKSLDLSFVGTICMELSNGEVSYVSRRYVSKIKKLLGL
jgi:DNA-binding LytR/AlgR family response regulator